MRKNFYFIYPEDKQGRKTGHTICVINKEDPVTKEVKTFHGIALCGPEDQFEYVIGRDLAYERAEEAYQGYVKRQQERAASK
jgi:hypothetical protein